MTSTFARVDVPDLPTHIFVFGSNERGVHGGGAAWIAHVHYGAVTGCGFGHTGRAFAIPTMDWGLRALPLESIAFYVSRFLEFAHNHPRLTFHVTQIGCGIAGFVPAEIAPLFAGAPPNVLLPPEFAVELVVGVSR